MKRVLRSCFEPLPRFMSMKCLSAVVALVLAGTGISVFEYLESSRAPVRRANPEPAACHAAEKACPSRAESTSSEARAETERVPFAPCSRSQAAPASSCIRGIGPSPAGGPSSEAQTGVRTAPPSVFEPVDGSVGG